MGSLHLATGGSIGMWGDAIPHPGPPTSRSEKSIRGSRSRRAGTGEDPLQANLQFLVARGCAHATHGMDVRELGPS